ILSVAVWVTTIKTTPARIAKILFINVIRLALTLDPSADEVDKVFLGSCKLIGVGESNHTAIFTKPFEHSGAVGKLRPRTVQVLFCTAVKNDPHLVVRAHGKSDPVVATVCKAGGIPFYMLADAIGSRQNDPPKLSGKCLFGMVEAGKIFIDLDASLLMFTHRRAHVSAPGYRSSASSASPASPVRPWHG